MEKVGSFGERLRRERELRGISLDEIVVSTKIGKRLLKALEEEQFDLLPGGIFNKSYVRAYAKCVGMDEDQAVAQYLEAAQEPPPDTRVIAHQHSSFHTDRLPDRSEFPVVPVLILLVIVAGAVGGWKTYQDHRSEREQRNTALSSGTVNSPANGGAAPSSTSEPVPGQPSAEPASSPPAVSGSSTNHAPGPGTGVPSHGAPAAQPLAGSIAGTAPSSAGVPFEVTISPKDSAWVSVKSDGQYVVRGIIKPPLVKTIRATGEVVFFTGNAGAVEVSFNGRSVPITGGPNTERVLVFTPQGVLQRAAAQ